MYNLFLFIHRFNKALACRIIPKDRIVPRFFTNKLLKKHCINLSGHVVNVSGWDDRDGEGDFYKNYFPKAESYTVTNAPEKGKGEGTGESLLLDLSKPLVDSLYKKYDVVYNNTTLEHILDFEQAFKNLCDMSKEVVIVIVPVIQQIHIAKTYGDYWRPTTMGLVMLFKKHGFETLVVKTNDQPFQPIYAFVLATRHPEKFRHIIIGDVDLEMGARLFGSSLKKHFIKDLLKI